MVMRPITVATIFLAGIALTIDVQRGQWTDILWLIPVAIWIIDRVRSDNA